MRIAPTFVTLLLATLLAAACGGETAGPGQGGVAHAGPKKADPASEGPPPPRRGAEHAVFSLLDNRLLAHVQRGGGLVAIPGAPGFVKYLRFARAKGDWKLGEAQDGKKVARAGRYATLEVPLTAEQAQAARMAWVRLYSPAARRMELKANGVKKGVEVALAAGWQTTEVAQANSGCSLRVLIVAPATRPTPVYEKESR